MAVQPFEGTPLGENAVAASAAMDALEMPFGDPARAELIQSGYTRDAYLREILDVMKAKRVLARVPMDKTQDIQYHDAVSYTHLQRAIRAFCWACIRLRR